MLSDLVQAAPLPEPPWRRRPEVPDNELPPRTDTEAIEMYGDAASRILHLAIAMVSEHLKHLDVHSKETARCTRLTRRRVAAGSVLERQSLDSARRSYLLNLDVLGAAESALPTTKAFDWLAHARTVLRAAGLNPRPAVKLTEEEAMHPIPRASQPPPSVTPPLCLTDQQGRVWTIPRSTAELSRLFNEYGRRHGRPSRAVQTAFVRHRQLDALRLLIMRGAEGERINLAAQALALGDLPPAPPRKFPADYLARHPEAERKMAEIEAKQDRAIVEALRREAEAS